MLGKNDQRAANRGHFVNSAYWLANCLAVIATILLMPLMWRSIGGYVEDLLYSMYDSGMASFAYLLVWLGSWAAVFFALRMTFVTAFVAAAIGIAVRAV